MGEEAIYAYRFEGKRFDCGSKLGYLQATVEFALAHPQVADGFRDYLKSLDLSALGITRIATGKRVASGKRARAGRGSRSQGRPKNR